MELVGQVNGDYIIFSRYYFILDTKQQMIRCLGGRAELKKYIKKLDSEEKWEEWSLHQLISHQTKTDDGRFKIPSIFFK